MGNMIKALLWRFGKYLEHFYMLTAKACCETVLFRESSNHVFHSLLFREYMRYDDHLFFQNV